MKDVLFVIVMLFSICISFFVFCLFFFKQRTADVLRISDWSSDVCSSDLETFLIQDGRVLAAAVREIEVHKSGFERFVAKAADEWSMFYGLTAIAFALGMGWAAGYLFRRK